MGTGGILGHLAGLLHRVQRRPQERAIGKAPALAEALESRLLLAAELATAINMPPSVDAGADRMIILSTKPPLWGKASDDGLPIGGTLTVAWSQVSGPAAAVFNHTDRTEPQVTFKMVGTYVLRLTANDGELSSYDDVTIIVNPDSSGNQPPVADASPDQTIVMSKTPTLAARVTDDGLPNGTLTFAWSQISGPGTVTFNHTDIKTPRITFSRAGTYVLRLTVSDGALSSSDDITIIVNPVSTTNPEIGMNTDFLLDYSDAWAFKDVFKMSRTWTVGEFNTVTKETSNTLNTAVVDEHGWPLELKTYTNGAGQLIRQTYLETYIGSGGARLAVGNYRAEWIGEGTITFKRAATEIERGTSNGRKYAIFNVAGPNQEGILVQITSIGTTDPIRDIHIWAPDYNGESFVGQDWKPGDNFSPFHPLFLERLRPFKAIRFCNWLAGYWSSLVNWEDRPKWDDVRQTAYSKGAAFEYVIELVNELHQDAWVNLPYMADDDFVRNMATMFRDNLDPSLKVYVEWSNEIWNWTPSFKTVYWLEEQMKLPENAGLSRYDIAAREIKRDFAIWSDVFQGQEQRIVRVFAGQAAYTSESEQILRRMDGQFDAISAAAYIFAKGFSLFTADSTLDDVFAAIDLSIPIRIEWLMNYKQLADQYSASLGRHIPLITYEGGQGLAGEDKFYQPLYYAAQQDPRMYTAYQKLFQGFRDLGGELFMHYSYVSRDTRYGSWGTLKYQDQPISDAPKYQALLDAVSGAIYVDPPVANAGGPYVTAEGESVQLNGDASTGTELTYEWDLDGDGIYRETGPGAQRGNETGPDAVYLANEVNGPAAYTANLRVTDKYGRSNTTAAIIRVGDVAPTLLVTGETAARAGYSYTLYLSASDPGLDEIRSWVIDWGDGTVQTIDENPSSVTRNYNSAGRFAIRASATDQDGTYTASPLSVVVTNDRPTAAITPQTRPVLAAAASDLTVKYSDELGIDSATLDGNEILVIAPNRARYQAPLATSTAKGKSSYATYHMPAPGGSWGPEDNGVYSVYLRPNTVADTAGLAAAKGVLGTFTVHLKGPGRTRPTAAWIGNAVAGASLVTSHTLANRDAFYVFSVTSPIIFNAALSDLTGDADLYLLSRRGKLLASSSHAGTRPETLGYCLASGTYYIQVHSADDSPKDYALNITASQVKASRLRRLARAQSR